MKPEREALGVFWRHKGFWAAQTVAFAVWGALAVSWFWLPDSKTWDVALAAVEACVVIAGALWLMAATFVYYHGARAEMNAGVGAAYREGLRRFPPLLVWAAIACAALWLAPRWSWPILALLLLPVAARISAKGLRTAWSARYFAQFALAAVAGALVPLLLIGWHPGVPGVALQTASLVARFALAYLLAITSWLILASLLAAPAPSHS